MAAPSRVRRITFLLLIVGWPILAVAGLALLGIGSIVWTVIYPYSRMAEFDCGQNRTITVYRDSFCDAAFIPCYEVCEGSRVVVPKTCTTLGFSCETAFRARDLKLVSREDGNLVAVVYVPTGEIALIHDFSTGQSYPHDDHPSTKAALESRLAIGPENKDSPPSVSP